MPNNTSNQDNNIITWMDINPWRGLLTYEDPYKTEGRTFSFTGREQAKGSVFAMIDNNLFVTLYGKTGIGKSSLLNAGVCPMLRSRGYVPVVIRLKKEDESYSKRIIEELEKEIIENERGQVKTSFPDIKNGNYQSVEYLWDYFCKCSFVSKDGEEVFPVIILDQFEEIFRPNKEKSTKKDAALLLRQLYALIDDSRSVPETEGYSSETNYRFVISIREDDLFYLEDTIDAYSLADMKQNRYRLPPLQERDAREIISLGNKYIDEEGREEIINYIIRNSKDENEQISTNLLSLLCSEAFIQSDGKITLATIKKLSDDPLKRFYLDCVSNLSSSSRQFIEDKLVDNDRRKFEKRKVFEDTLSKPEQELLTKGRYRIIQDVKAGNLECVELIHDTLAKAIFNLKVSKEEEERLKEENERIRIKKKKNKQLLTTGIIILVATIIGLAFLIIKQNKYKSERGAEVEQRFSINVIEDELVTQAGDNWRATLLVIGKKKDTVLIDTLLNTTVNDKIKDSSFYFVSKMNDSIYISLTYDKVNTKFDQIDTSFSIGYLTGNPNVKIPVRLNLKIKYSGVVVTNLGDLEIPIPNAVVVLNGHVQRTAEDGSFSFSFKDSIKNDTNIYIIKSGFASKETKYFLADGIINERFILDALGEFKQHDSICRTTDSLWKLYNSMKGQKGIPTAYGSMKPTYKITFKDKPSDKLTLYAIFDGREDTNSIKIRGVYWLESDYKKYEKIDHPYYAYYLFEGRLDDGTHSSERTFYIESTNFLNNKQTITGSFGKNKYKGPFSGVLSTSSGVEGLF